MSLLEKIRQLAMANSISYTGHAIDRLLDRDISIDTIKTILKSSTNQITEVQSKSNTQGKEHTDDRILVFAPDVDDDIIVVSIVLMKPTDEIRVITVEYVDDSIWSRNKGSNPELTRK